MKSKLNDYSELVASRLQQGQSYVEIVNELSALGCITTRQNLISWLKRRSARIQSRLHLADPLSAAHASEQKAPAASARTKTRGATVAPLAPIKEPVRTMPVLTRSSSVVKQPPSAVDLVMEELAQQAAKPAVPTWKKKSV